MGDGKKGCWGDRLKLGVLTVSRVVSQHLPSIAFLSSRTHKHASLQRCWIELRALHTLSTLSTCSPLSSTLAFSGVDFVCLFVCFVNRFEPEAQNVKVSHLGWCGGDSSLWLNCWLLMRLFTQTKRKCHLCSRWAHATFWCSIVFGRIETFYKIETFPCINRKKV